MTENYLSNTALHPILSPDVCYTNILGIMDEQNFRCQNHTEDNHVLICVTRGCLFCEQSDTVFSVAPGEYLLLDKRILHSYYFGPQIPSEIVWMHINGNVALSLIARIQTLSPLPFIGCDPRILPILQRVISMHREHSVDPFSHSADIITALHIILEEAYYRYQETTHPEKELAFRQSIDAILNTTALSDITLQYLSEQLHMNKYYFSHLFQKIYEVSPMQYVNRFKLAKARHFLRFSDLKIILIAKECGFSSPAYFSAAFHKECGCTPAEYREKNKL